MCQILSKPRVRIERFAPILSIAEKPSITLFSCSIAEKITGKWKINFECSQFNVFAQENEIEYLFRLSSQPQNRFRIWTTYCDFFFYCGRKGLKHGGIVCCNSFYASCCCSNSIIFVEASSGFAISWWTSGRRSGMSPVFHAWRVLEFCCSMEI